MNYFDRIVDALNSRLPGNDDLLLRFYALLVLTAGIDVTRENVHDAWAAWRTLTRPDHPDLVPFDQLSPENQERDQEYVDGIRDVAATLADLTD